jgi:CHAT domain-containing protein
MAAMADDESVNHKPVHKGLPLREHPKCGDDSSASDQERTAELLHLLDRWHQTNDLEEEIVFAEQALQLDEKILEWTADLSREQVRGALLFNIGTNYQKRHQTTRADDLEIAIVTLEAALSIRTREAYPEEWARTIHHLAHAYSDRVAGDHAGNIETAIGYYHDALTILTSKEFPQIAADIESSLALAYANRIYGERAENIERAIACCESALNAVSRNDFHYQWGQAQSNLGLAYSYRILGDRAENLERAIEAYRAALAVLTRESYQHAWGLIQNNLALAYSKRIRGERAENLEHAIAAHEAALSALTREAYPLDWATAQNNLSTAYIDRVLGERAENLERAIALLEAAITVYTREMFPHDWAMCQLNLGLVYQRRILGLRLENIEKAIGYCKAALQVYSREAFPQRWAATQHNLALAYSDRILGDRGANIEEAIGHIDSALTVYTRHALPQDWAESQILLAIAYRDRIFGEPGHNLEKSIIANNSALTVLTRDAYPLGWATIQSNLVNSYTMRIRGERGENLERAINAGEAALSVLTREGQPLEWGRAQNNLAAAYARSLRGDPAENLEKAIAHFEAALSYFTRHTDAEQWALLQENLGLVYTDRIRGDQARNIEKAIFHFDAALTHFGPKVDPVQWAKIQNNIGLAYWNRVDGERASNLEKAIYHFRGALSVRTFDALPHDWAQTQHNLGLVYADRIVGCRADNLQRSIASYEAALTVYTPESSPRDHLISSRLLGATLVRKGDWEKARLALLSARDAFLLLFGQGLVETEARELIRIAGPLFSELAFAIAELGDAAAALNLLSEGKARLIAIALKLQTLELPPDQRVHLGRLRREIREADRGLDTVHGTERTTALERLVMLRSELRSLVEIDDKHLPSRGSALAIAGTLACKGGAVAAPIITNVGAKVLIVTLAEQVPRITVIEQRELTTNRLREFMEGPADAITLGGWIGAYNIQYLPENEQAHRIGEWLSAIEGVGDMLWQLLGRPLQDELLRHGVKPGGQLFWLPTDALGLLPLGLARDPDTGSSLGSTYEIAYAPSLEILQSAMVEFPAHQEPTLAAIINPTEDLHFTEIEGQLVARHFGPLNRIVIERKAATSSAVLAALKGANHWHFAAHGAFSWDDARDSAIILSEHALLTVAKLFEVENLGRPRLVVLSACETGLYDIRHAPDEFVGLPGAFMALGASGVLGTLWPVDDRATALLVARFYDGLVDDQLTPPAALKRAQEWLCNATRRDIIDYVRMVKKAGKIVDSQTAHELEDSLSRGACENTRFALIWAWLQQRDKAQAQKMGREGSHAVRMAKIGERLFAHPYFWGGFIYTGL